MALVIFAEPILFDATKVQGIGAYASDPASGSVRKVSESGRESSGDISGSKASEGKSEAASAETSNYVTDLRLYPAGNNETDRANVIWQAQKDGYKLVGGYDDPADLNTGTGKAYIFLGYKTGKDQKKAIRGVKKLEMESGYEWFSYEEVVKEKMKELSPLADDILYIGAEFQENLDAEAKCAVYAKELLNHLYFNKDMKDTSTSGRRYLGDYLSSDEMDEDMLKNLIIRMNSGALSAMYTQLALAVSDLDEKWCERIEESDVYTGLEDANAAELADFDLSYYEYATELLPVLQDFAKEYWGAEGRKAKNGGKPHMAEVEGTETQMTAEEFADAERDLTSDEITAVTAAAEEDEHAEDIMYEAAYESLKEYPVGDTNAAEYILNLAEDNYENDKRSYRKLYPLVDSLTIGQLAAMKIVGLAQMAVYLNQDDAFYTELDKNIATVEEKFREATGGETAASVWMGVNTEFYEREVALTSAAYREAKASENYEELTKEGDFYEKMNKAFHYIGLICSFSWLAVSLVQIIMFFAGSQLSMWAACAGLVGTSVLSSVVGVIGCAITALSYVAIVALLVCAIWLAVKEYKDATKDKDKKEYTKMPTEVYDLDGIVRNGKKVNGYVEYKSVNNASGNPQDLNADEGKRWNLLYYTKTSGYGQPLFENDLKTVFTVTRSTDVPDGYSPVTCFGEKSPTNLNSFAYTSTPIYMYYVTENGLDSLDDFGEEDEKKIEVLKQYASGFKYDKDGNKTGIRVNEGEINKPKGNEKYLYGLMVSVDKSERVAKDAITKNKGYRIFEIPLPYAGGGIIYTEIGYASTSDPNQAIRDIRMVKDMQGDTISFGDATYVSAGTFDNGWSLVCTKYASAGPPVIDSFRIDEEKRESKSYTEYIEEGYEPVCSFSNRNAVPVNGLMTQRLYYKTSVKYTKGDEYIAGIEFASARRWSKYYQETDVKRLIGDRKLTDFGSDLCSYDLLPIGLLNYSYANGMGWLSKSYYRYSLKMCYTRTCNPYRAISDLMIHTATTRLDGLPASIRGKEGDYVAADHFCTSSKVNFGINKEGWMDRYVKEHTYIDPCFSKGVNNELDMNSGYTIKDNMFLRETNLQKKKPKGRITYERGPYRAQGMYQLGPVPKKAPLKIEDVVVTSSATVPEGMRTIRRFTDPFPDGPVNIAYETEDKDCTPVYVCLRGTAPTRGKYISGIYVATYQRPQNTNKHTYTDEELNALAVQCDDSCILQLLPSADEVIDANFAIGEGDAWYTRGTNRPTNTNASYIGVTRTDDENYAITGLLFCKADNEPRFKLKVGTHELQYNRVENKINGYWLYYTKNPYANGGAPLRELTVDGNFVKNSQPTALGIRPVDKEHADYMHDFVAIGGKYLHLDTHTPDSPICDIKLFTSKEGFNDIILQAYAEGYYNMVSCDLNRNAGGDYIYLAYKKKDMTPDEESGGSGESAKTNTSGENTNPAQTTRADFSGKGEKPKGKEITNLVYTVGKAPQKTLDWNRNTYSLVSDVSLNQGAGGKSIYLYATTDTLMKIKGRPNYQYVSPLNDITLCTGDLVPSNYSSNKYGNWEEIYDTNWEVVDVNEGVMKFDSEWKTTIDIRLFLFKHRINNTIMPGFSISRGFVR